MLEKGRRGATSSLSSAPVPRGWDGHLLSTPCPCHGTYSKGSAQVILIVLKYCQTCQSKSEGQLPMSVGWHINPRVTICPDVTVIVWQRQLSNLFCKGITLKNLPDRLLKVLDFSTVFVLKFVLIFLTIRGKIPRWILRHPRWPWSVYRWIFSDYKDSLKIRLTYFLGDGLITLLTLQGILPFEQNACNYKMLKIAYLHDF